MTYAVIVLYKFGDGAVETHLVYRGAQSDCEWMVRRLERSTPLYPDELDGREIYLTAPTVVAADQISPDYQDRSEWWRARAELPR